MSCFCVYFGKDLAKLTLTRMATGLYRHKKELVYVTLDTILKFSGVTQTLEGEKRKLRGLITPLLYLLN